VTIGHSVQDHIAADFR